MLAATTAATNTKKSHETHKLRRSYGTISHTEKNAVRNHMGVNIHHRLICCERLMLLLRFSLSRALFLSFILCMTTEKQNALHDQFFSTGHLVFVRLLRRACECVCKSKMCAVDGLLVEDGPHASCGVCIFFVGFMNEMRILP